MPTYEYSCDGCGGEFERFESISARPNKKCQLCGERKARRVISSGGGVIFKGTGFYSTDYRKPEKKSGEKTEDPKPKEKGSDPD